MKYSKEFIRLVKTEYFNDDNFTLIEKYLNEGNVLELGDILHKSRLFDGSANRINTMLYNGFVKELQKESAKATRREMIYSQWYDLYEVWLKSNKTKHNFVD